MKYLVDIDGTICTNTYGDYANAEPYVDRIARLNALFDEGHEIHYWTARGSNSGVDWTFLTRQQIIKWNAKHTSLQLGKPAYDLWIDDKAINSESFFK
jgi:hypothetical protein